MDRIDFSDVGMVRCTIYNKNEKKLDTIVIKPRNVQAPYNLPQKVLREVYALINKRREYLSRQEELPSVTQ